MAVLLRLVLVMLLPIALFAACGGDDDDTGSGDTGQTATAESSGDGDETPSDDATDEGEDDEGDGGSERPKFDDGAYSKGEVHVEISGDRDVTVDAEGNGFVSGGFALFTYASSDASVILGFSGEDEPDPGAISITLEELATGAEWGTDCELTVDQSDSSVEGEFSCDDVEGIATGSTDVLKVDIRGTFSASR